ncbi:MAG: hypothetical protein AB8I08_22445 [Sandaracinaceae bacterium]
MRLHRLAPLVLVCLASGCGGDLCSEDALRDALNTAPTGTRVEVGDCEVDTASGLTVPSGVSLAGSTPSSAVVASGPVALALSSGATLESLLVRAASAGVSASGGSVLRDVTIVGPVTADNAETVGAADGDRVGLLVRDADDVVLERVSVSGFADLGVAVVDSDAVRFSDSEITTGLGAALLVRGGSVDLSGVGIRGMYQGGRLLPVFGAVFLSTAITSSALDVCDNEGVGVFQDGGTAVHRGLRVHENALAGVWTQRATGFEVSETSSIVSNGGAGLVMINPMGSHMLTDLVVRDTREIPESRGMFASEGVADGVHLVADDTSSLRVMGVELDSNARSGMLLHVRGGMVDVATLVDVTADAEGAAVGVTAQTPTRAIPSGAWDADVTRTGAALANDVAPDLLDIFGIVEPMGLPAPPE